MSKKKKTLKKTTPTKRKTPAKKTKKVVDPHAGKRYFMLEVGGYGGEFIVGKVNEKFVKYWLKQDDDSYLSDHITAMHNQAGFGDIDNIDDEVPEGFDVDSPEVVEGRKFVEYWELDDIEHETVMSKEHCSFTLHEIKLHEKAVYTDGELEWDSKESKKRNFDYTEDLYTIKNTVQDHITETLNTVYTTEMFLNDKKKGVKDPIPAVMIYDMQKGSFGRIVIETDGADFDINKLVVATNENTMTTYMSEFFYDKKPLHVSYDNLSTWGKGFHAGVGYISKQDITFDREELLTEGWKELDENQSSQ